MQARVASQARVWVIAALALAAVLWFLGDIVLPFVIGAGLAYFLNPVVEGLARRGLPRWAAVVIIASAALGALILVVVALVPALISQATALFETAPAAFNALSAGLTERFPDLMLDDEGLRRLMGQVGDWARAQGGEVLARMLSSAR
jgi:predicted PurR-regulated permease PerM